MVRSLIPKRQSFTLARLWGISVCFQTLSPSLGQINYALLTRAPLTLRFVRLACVRHAASVHPEPGSNSPYSWGLIFSSGLAVCYHYSNVKLLLLLACSCEALCKSLPASDRDNYTNLTPTCQAFFPNQFPVYAVKVV